MPIPIWKPALGFRHTFIKNLLVLLLFRKEERLLSLSKYSCYDTDNEYRCENEQPKGKEVERCTGVIQDVCEACRQNRCRDAWHRALHVSDNDQSDHHSNCGDNHSEDEADHINSTIDFLKHICTYTSTG